MTCHAHLSNDCGHGSEFVPLLEQLIGSLILVVASDVYPELRDEVSNDTAAIGCQVLDEVCHVEELALRDVVNCGGT